jgi:mercuric ion binding protein
MKKLLLASILVFGFSSAYAAPQTVTLSVPGMYCEVCPITVKKSLEKVPGVSKVKVSFEAKEAIVTYDDTKANVDKLTHATTAAGYPSTLKGAKVK